MTTATINTTATATITSLDQLIEQAWKAKEIVMDATEGEQYAADTDRLASEGIRVARDGGRITFARRNVGKADCEGRRYIMPPFADEVRGIVKNALDGKGMANIMLTGSAGTGKTEFIHRIAAEYGMKVFQVNGSEGLTAADFYGTMSVAVDAATKQNYTYFEKGPLYRAFIEGTQLDADGNQVLDANGEPIVIGKPAVFFLDEFAAMLPEVFLGVFNRAMEIPRAGKARSIEITMDNGRIVKSHPAMVMFLAGNTVGTGNSGKYQMGYTAQGNKMDESTRNRVSAFFKFGYNRAAEEDIATRTLNDDFEVSRLMKFRDNVRSLYKNEKVETLFTTRSLVAVCDLAKAFRASGNAEWMCEAVRVAVYNGLPETDQPAFNEVARMIWDKDYAATEREQNGYDYI